MDAGRWWLVELADDLFLLQLDRNRGGWVGRCVDTETYAIERGAVGPRQFRCQQGDGARPRKQYRRKAAMVDKRAYCASTVGARYQWRNSRSVAQHRDHSNR